MALTQRFRKNGSYFKGYTILVLAVTTSTIFSVTVPFECAGQVDSISIIPGIADGGTIGIDRIGSCTRVIAEEIPNIGGGAWDFSLPGVEVFEKGDALKFTYTCSTGTGQIVNVLVSQIR